MAAGKQTVLQFFPSTTSLSARVHPVVLFNICDCYVRRPDQADRVIGTLLGSVSPDGTVEIKNSYAVPHNESADQVALDIDYHHNMFMSHQKVNPKEVIVGWYSTGFGVSGGSTLIHEFYSREVSNPVHLTVDTGFQNVDILKMTMVDKIPNDLQGMEASMERLLALIDDVYKYVDDVVEGRETPDNNIGRFIADTLSSVPKLSTAAFDKLFNDRIQDNLALVYLSSLTRTQLSVAEKLNTAAQIL
ncbi:Eukaryotic translation initiation factor 3 subunit F [Cocos nucifera]|uniref:Eukaryotic translation initiation factor 3 subunit F n=1 Tax=Cocos nucifera TaxID=13894 RepID=A0A8K0N029_COCNU|nr:Eukaryotic translation initiation factor 3 subunit F [Cocos nucifera]